MRIVVKDFVIDSRTDRIIILFISFVTLYTLVSSHQFLLHYIQRLNIQTLPGYANEGPFDHSFKVNIVGDAGIHSTDIIFKCLLTCIL